jgi:N-methylhydantoinase A/oxoprolinase/acetone carboxylase beta subunit
MLRQLHLTINTVNGKDIYPLSKTQLAQEAQTIKDKDIRSAVLIGVHSTSFPDQENEAAIFLSEQLGPGFDVSCSHHLGNAGFLERENTAILNASIRRFAASMIGGLVWTINQTLPHAKLFMTLNDGTISQASYAAQYPLKCFASGPTNSARGAAFIGMETLGQHEQSQDVDGDLLVIDVGGTTTDVCSLLPNGYPKQSAAFVKLAGVKTNLSMPQIHNIALGGGSIVRQKQSGVTVGPDSVGANELTQSLAVGGTVFTAADLVKLTAERLQELDIPTEFTKDAKYTIKQMIESAVEFAKTKPTDARVILVGGGSFVLPDAEQLKGVSTLVRPKYYEVANAIGAAIAKVSGRVDRMIIPKQQSVDSLVEEGKQEAIHLCYEAGGRADTAAIVDLEIIPETYTFDGSFRLLVRAVSDIDAAASGLAREIEPELYNPEPIVTESKPESSRNNMKVQEDVSQSQMDITTYHPAIFNDIWTLTETDIDLLVDGTGVLGVGCMGEATNYLIGLKEAIRSGKKVQIVPLRAVKESEMICSSCWIV